MLLCLIALAQSLRELPEVKAFIQNHPGIAQSTPLVDSGFPWWLQLQHFLNMFFMLFIMRSGLRVGAFVPATYLRQVMENSDFRKYDDGLRMIIDCSPELAATLERRLAAAAGTANYGLHRQNAAMMTCFTPSPARSDHVHFIDGAQGGYAAAATALKAALSASHP